MVRTHFQTDDEVPDKEDKSHCQSVALATLRHGCGAKRRYENGDLAGECSV